MRRFILTLIFGSIFSQSLLAAIGIDTNGSIDQSNANTTITLPSVSTHSTNELLLALIATDYLGGTNTTVTSVTGGGLTWTLVSRTNVQSGTSEIWRAFSPTTLSGISVAASLSQKVSSSLTVMSFSGVNTSGTNGSGAIGAINSANAKSGASTATLVTTVAGSWVIGVGNDFDNAIARIPGPDQNIVHQYLSTVGDTYWVQMQNSATPLSGTSVTINDTASTGDRYNLSIVEILPLASTLPILNSIGVTPTNVTISTGITQQFTATGTYPDGSTQNLTSLVSWVSSSTSVAGINNSGLATGLNAGTSTISAALEGVSGNTNLSVLVPSTLTSLTIWPSTAIPGTVDSGPDSAVELGVKFSSDVSGTVSGIRFYKGIGNTGTHVGNLWDSTGAKLASATFTGETATGWQQVDFATPVAITGNAVYFASYHTNVGHYSDDQNYFAGKGVDSPPLHALANGGNGVFAYSSASVFPNGSWHSSNYWVDVVFTTGLTQPLISVSLIPNKAAIQVNDTQQFTATVAGTSNQAVTWANDGGAISSSGLYSSPSTGTYQVVATSAADTTKSAASSVIVMAAPSPPTTIFYDDFNGTSLNSNWTVISRHGEYAQNETECNTPKQVSVANSIMSISTIAQKTTCGDFNSDGSVRTTPTVWPYATGDIQWSNFNFTYGTVEIRAQFPDSRSNTWPATWLLGANCQITNPLTGDTGLGTCPNIGQAGYTEIDMTECYNATSPWCQLHVANPNFGIGGDCDAVYPASDTNWHVYETVWTASDIKQYIDGVLVSTCNQSLGNPMFLIIQTQTGGSSGTPNNAYLPATLNIDYVKVTQP